MKLLSLGICAFILLLLIDLPCEAANMKKDKIEGFITYRERITMPPNAKVLITLYEAGKDGTQVISEKYISTENHNVPLPFSIEYSAPPVKNDAGYALKAIIFAQDNHVFASSPLTPVTLPITKPMTILTHIGSKDAHADEPTPRKIDIPTTYSGEVLHNNTLTKITLRFEHDHGFILRRETAQGGEVHSELETGRWRQIAGGYALELGGNGRTPLRLLVRPGNVLVFADRPESGGVSQELFPVPDGGPWPNSRTLTGALSYPESEPIFRDCSSGVAYPVSRDGAYEALKKAFLAAIPSASPNKSLQVRFEGHTVHEERDGKDYVRVDSFSGPVPGAMCPDNDNDMEELTDRYWKLLEIDGKKALAFENQTEPHIILTKDKKEYRLSGSDGCNRLVGMANISEKDLKFGQLGSTMMLCPQGEEQATAFAQALSEVNGWRVFGDVLELLRHGEPVLVFEAVLMN